jgi:hypothetical protein
MFPEQSAALSLAEVSEGTVAGMRSLRLRSVSVCKFIALFSLL